MIKSFKHLIKIRSLINISEQKILMKNLFSNIKDNLNSKLEESAENSKLLRNRVGKIIDKRKSLVSKAEKLLERGPEDVILKQSDIWARSITWSLMAGTAFGIGWLGLAKTEEIVVVQGRLEPVSGVIDIQMPLDGVTDKIKVKEGDLVKKDQILITLDTESNQIRKKSLETNLKLEKDIENRLESLSNEGAISEIQFLQQKNKVIEIKSNIEQNNIILKYQEIASPIDGVVFDMKAKTSGYVARSTEPIMKIVPIDKLRAKVEIESRSIGFVSTGKKADISIDSYPASDFGVLEGIITSIGSDALPPVPQQGKGYRFPAIITLDSQTLQIKNGRKLPLQVGMSLTANIKLRRVTYLQLLLNNFQDKADSLRTL
jgi:hemolysin D